MLSSSSTPSLGTPARMWQVVFVGFVLVETLLIVSALVPAQLWARLFPHMLTAAQDGPFPPVVAPVITVLLYTLPSIIGFMSQQWQRALFYATLPAWIGLGVFLVAATSRVGTFYLVSTDHITANVSVLELFAVLGGIGWLARYMFKVR